MQSVNRKKISFVIPVYNEVGCIEPFLYKYLIPEIKKINKYRSEIILIDDGSTDGTIEILQKISAKEKGVKIIAFSRNFGKELALSAGLKYAESDAVIMMDSDGQHPTKLIPSFIAAWENGAEIVTGVRKNNRNHKLIPRMGSRMFYKILNIMGHTATVPGSTDFRLIDRVVINEFNNLSEHNRITRGLIDWMGFEQTVVEISDFEKRLAGKPSYDFKKLFHLAIDSFISLSTTPLVIFGYIGAFITLGSFILGMFVIIQQYILGDPLQLYWNGAVQMSIFVTFMVGLVLISQATTALYISHIHAETQNRPLYIINKKKSKNIDFD